jgi:hypothetical protein
MDSTTTRLGGLSDRRNPQKEVFSLTGRRGKLRILCATPAPSCNLGLLLDELVDIARPEPQQTAKADTPQPRSPPRAMVTDPLRADVQTPRDFFSVEKVLMNLGKVWHRLQV